MLIFYFIADHTGNTLVNSFSTVGDDYTKNTQIFNNNNKKYLSLPQVYVFYLVV